jgi:hypothetical protein
VRALVILASMVVSGASGGLDTIHAQGGPALPECLAGA